MLSSLPQLAGSRAIRLDGIVKSLHEPTDTLRLTVLDSPASKSDDLVPGLGTSGDLQI